MRKYAIGIDIGGTKTAGVLIDRDGNIHARVKRPTPVRDGPNATIDLVSECIRELEAGSPGGVAGIGIGVAAMTDSRRGVVILASNLKWENVPLRDEVIKRLGDEWAERVWVDKDTNAAALAEMFYGVARGARHVLYVTIGTGIGGGMILDGRLYHGATEGAGDIGHLVLEPEGPQCGCGKRGCLEALASGPAILREALAALDRGEETSLRQFDPQDMTAEHVAMAALNGDELARKLFTRAGQYIGAALAYYADINNPEMIVLGGGVSAVGDLLAAPIRETIRQRALPGNAEAAKVVLAGLGQDSGAIGAASLVWHNAGKGD